MNKIGITEAGDAGLDFTWVNKMNTVAMGIIITKNCNDKFIEQLLKFKDKVILHATITGYGGTVVEPNVPNYKWSFAQLQKLIDRGFPKEQIVLRIDPIIPTFKGCLKAQDVLNENCKTVNIRRVRFSLIDMYSHVRERFEKANLYNPYGGNNFYPSWKHKKDVVDSLRRYNNIFESCNEDIKIYTNTAKGCISQTDVDILGLDISLTGKSGQRKGCLCPSNKTELLERKCRCPHKCLYCYWRD